MSKVELTIGVRAVELAIPPVRVSPVCADLNDRDAVENPSRAFRVRLECLDDQPLVRVRPTYFLPSHGPTMKLSARDRRSKLDSWRVDPRMSPSWAWAYPVVIVLASCARPSASPQPDPPPVADAADSSAPDPTEMPPTEQPPAESASTQYLVEGKPVDKATFDALVASTTEVPGTWYCDEMIDGGETGWDGKDAEGTVYEIRLLSVEAGSTNSIRAKGDHP